MIEKSDYDFFSSIYRVTNKSFQAKIVLAPNKDFFDRSFESILSRSDADADADAEPVFVGPPTSSGFQVWSSHNIGAGTSPIFEPKESPFRAQAWVIKSGKNLPLHSNFHDIA